MLRLIKDSIHVGSQSLEWSPEDQCYILERVGWTFAVFQEGEVWAADVLRGGYYIWESAEHADPQEAADEMSRFLSSGLQAFKALLDSK